VGQDALGGWLLHQLSYNYRMHASAACFAVLEHPLVKLVQQAEHLDAVILSQDLAQACLALKDVIVIDRIVACWSKAVHHAPAEALLGRALSRAHKATQKAELESNLGK